MRRQPERKIDGEKRDEGEGGRAGWRGITRNKGEARKDEKSK